MFKSTEPVEYFKENYTNISNGDKQFAGFKIEVNPMRTSSEENAIPADSGWKFMRITINKDNVLSAINGLNINEDDNEENTNITNENNINENQQNNDSTINDNRNEKSNNIVIKDSIVSTSKLPKTWLYNSIIPILIIFSIVSLITTFKLREYKDIK